MKIRNALKQMSQWRTTISLADDHNALQTAKRSLKEWQALLDEAEEMPERDDLKKWIKKHIARIEA